MIKFKKSFSKDSSVGKHRRRRIYNSRTDGHLVLLFYGVISLNEIFTTFIFSDSDANKLWGRCENNRHTVRSYGCAGRWWGGVITAAAGSDG